MSIHQFQPNRQAGIGAQLEQIRMALLRNCDHLEDGADDALRKRVGAIRDKLEKYMANVSIVGQVKAGKSSLVNSLVRQSDLMPTDINPWTSVVTRLCFGHPSGETTGGRFWFFDDDHWDRLATRGGRLGELTDGLLEDYKRDQLAEQVQAMRDRAKLRLGDKFETLLGKRHRFETITSDIMERYVCAGDAPKERLRNSQAGRYADITHTAEIYFDSPPFSCPVCIVDTPGTNDPLLIREEITQQNLEKSDFFIVVLSAHQALSESDLKLLRIMKAMNRDQLVVFVNRVDEVDNLSHVQQEMQSLLKSRLRKELGNDVPVILGSAAWADYALTGRDDEIDHGLVEIIASQREPVGMRLSGSYSIGDDPKREAALRASGLLELETALSEVLLSGATASLFQEAVDELQALSRQSVDSTQRTLEALQAPDEGGAAFFSTAARDILFKTVTTSLVESEEEIISINDAKWARVSEKLGKVAEEFAAKAVAEHGKLSPTKAAKAMTESVDVLRDDLKSTYLSGFHGIRELLWSELKDVKPYKRFSDGTPASDHIRRLTLGTIGLLSLEATPMPIYRPVALDFATSWLGNIFGKSDTQVKAAVQTAKLHFADICAELVLDGRQSFEQYVRTTCSRYTEDLAWLLDDLSQAKSAGTQDADVEMERAKLRLEQLSKDIDVLAGLETSFNAQRQSEYA